MCQKGKGGEPARRRWLCVAYAFAPMNRSGTHRTVGFVRHLWDHGWDATVLTATLNGEPSDDALVDRVAPSTRVVRTRCGDLVSLAKRVLRLGKPLPPQSSRDHREVPVGTTAPVDRRGLREWVSRLLQTPDSRIGWIPSAVRAGLRVIRCEKPEVIYSTSPYASAHLIAMILRWWSGLPWVADFRDPWGDNPFRKGGYKSLDRLDGWLEWMVLKSASHVVMNTDTAHDALCIRHPRCAVKSSTITNGIDFDLIEAVAPKRVVAEDRFALTHCGQFYGLRTPTPWFEALGRLRCFNPAVANRVRFVLVGGDAYEGRMLKEMAAECGVDDLVVVVGKRSHGEALSIMAGSDALALATSIGPGGELQVPNKLFEYLGMGKPIVAAVDARNPSKRLLEDSGASVAICATNDVHALADSILACVTRGPTATNCSRPTGVRKLGRAFQAALLAGIFDKLGNSRASASSLTLADPSESSPVKGRRKEVAC